MRTSRGKSLKLSKTRARTGNPHPGCAGGAETAEGEIKSLGATGLTPEQREVYGALVGALLSLGMTGSEEGVRRGAEMGASAFAERIFGMSQQDIQAIAHDVPPGQTLLLVLFEHRWAIPLKEAIMSANGETSPRGSCARDTGGCRRRARRRH